VVDFGDLTEKKLFVPQEAIRKKIKNHMSKETKMVEIIIMLAKSQD
jgi:hypothetical protein